MKIFVIFCLLFAVTGSLCAKSQKEQVTEIEKSYLAHKLGLDQKKGHEKTYEVTKPQLSFGQVKKDVKEDKELKISYLKKKFLVFSKYKNALIAKAKSWFSPSIEKSMGLRKNAGTRAAPTFTSVHYNQISKGPSPRVEFAIEYADIDNDIETISVNLGDGNIVVFDADDISNPLVFDHIFLESAHYNILVEIEDSASNISKHSFYVDIVNDIIPNNQFSAIADSIDNLKVNFEILVDDLAPSSVTTWFVGCPSGGRWEKVFSCTFPSPGTYPVNLYSRNADKGVEFYETEIVVGGAEVIVRPVPKINADYLYGKAPLVVNLDASESFSRGKNIVSYEWEFDDSQNPFNKEKGIEVKREFKKPGVYFVHLRATDEDGVTKTRIQQIVVKDPIDRNPEIILFNEAPLTVRTEGGRSAFPMPLDERYIHWDMGDGNFYNGRHITHTYAAAGTYTVSLKLLSLDGGFYNVSKNITISNTLDTPIANITVDTLRALPYQNVSFDASSSVDPQAQPLEFLWLYADGEAPSTLDYDVRSFSNLGMMPVEVFVTNSRGLSAMKVFQIAVLSDFDLFLPYYHFSPKIGVAPLEVSFDGRESFSKNGQLKYDWKINGNSLSSESNFVKTFNDPGNYFIQYAIADSQGNEILLYDSFTVLSSPYSGPNNAPIAQINNIIDSINERKYYFDCTLSTDSDGTVDYCEWSINGKKVSDGKFFNYEFIENENYVIELVAIDNHGAKGTVVKNVDFRSAKNTIVLFEYFPMNPLASQSVTFGAEKSIIQGREIVSYTWNLGDGNTKYGPIVQHSYSATGNYNVLLTITDDQSGTHTYSEMISVVNTENLDGFNIVARSHSLHGEQVTTGVYRTLNYPEKISFSIRSSLNSVTQPKNTEWDFGDGNIAYGENVEHVYLKPGNYLVTATTKNKFDTSIVRNMIVDIPYGRQCYNDNDLSACLFFENNGNNILSLKDSYWQFEVSENVVNNTSGTSWLKLELFDRDVVKEVNISDIATISSGKIRISKQGLLAKNIDLSLPVKVYLNNKDSAGLILRAKSDSLYFGGSRLVVNSIHDDAIFEVVNGEKLYRKYVKLNNEDGFTLDDIPSGEYIIISKYGDQVFTKRVSLAARKEAVVDFDFSSNQYQEFKNQFNQKANLVDNLPAWSNGLCGEPAPFGESSKKMTSENEVLTHPFSSYLPMAAEKFKALSYTTPKDVVMTCRIVNPALLYSLNEWKYKDGPARCQMGSEAHPKWNEYLSTLKSNDAPIVVSYKIRDAWSSDVVTGYVVTSVSEILRADHIKLKDLTSYVGIPKDLNEDEWSLKFKKILPIPVNFKRPEISFKLDSYHSSSNENFYEIQCGIESSKIMPMVSRLMVPFMDNGTIHHRDYNARVSLENQFKFFPVHFDGRATSAHVANNESTKVRYAVEVNYNNFLGVQWQGINVTFKYADQMINQYYPFLTLNNDYAQRKVKGNILIDTTVLGNQFKWVQGVKNIDLVIAPVGKMAVDGDFVGASRTFTYRALFDLQTVRTDFTNMCSNGVFGATRSTFVTDGVLTNLLEISANNGNLRCYDASTPFGGPFRLNTWRYADNRYGNMLSARSFFLTGQQDAYDNFNTGLDIRKQDVGVYLNFSALSEDVSEIATEQVFNGTSYVDSDRKKILDFCNPATEDPKFPCSKDTAFLDIDFDKVLQVCQWYSTSSFIPDGCPNVDYSKIQRFALWVEMNATLLDKVSLESSMHLKYSNGLYSPLSGYAPIRWQEMALVNGLWPDGKPIWKLVDESLSDQKILSCHHLTKGCSPMKKFFVEDDRAFSSILISVPWR